MISHWQSIVPEVFKGAARVRRQTSGGGVACRCPRPDSQFKAVTMGREGKPPATDTGVAERAAFQPRGREHAFALNTLAA